MDLTDLSVSKLKVATIDDVPGQSNYHYKVSSPNGAHELGSVNFQQLPVFDGAENGITIGVVLVILLHHIQPFTCSKFTVIRYHLTEALKAFKS